MLRLQLLYYIVLYNICPYYRPICPYLVLLSVRATGHNSHTDDTDTSNRTPTGNQASVRGLLSQPKRFSGPRKQKG